MRISKLLVIFAVGVLTTALIVWKMPDIKLGASLLFPYQISAQGTTSKCLVSNGTIATWDNCATGSGITSLNGLVGATQTFTTSSASVTDFDIRSAGSVHTFHIPNSSAANRGLLIAADWTTFNNKLSSPVNLSTQTNFVAGNYLTTSTAGQVNVDPEIASGTIPFGFYDTTSTSPYKFYGPVRLDFGATFTRFDCADTTATTTIAVYQVLGVTSTVSNATIIPSITCGSAGNTTTTFTNETIPAGQYVLFEATSTAGTPTRTIGNLLYSVND